MTLETAICLADQWWGWTATCLPLRTGEWRGSCASVRMDARNVPLLTTTDTEQWRHSPDAGGSAAPPRGGPRMLVESALPTTPPDQPPARLVSCAYFWWASGPMSPWAGRGTQVRTARPGAACAMARLFCPQ